jgi:anti-sigma B factor antagonist
LSELGIKERRIGSVTILDTDALLRIKLRFGASSVPLENAAASLLSAGQKHILLSLEGVNSISAKNLGELVATYVAVKNGGGQFKLFNLTPMVRQLMQVTNLFAVFQLYETEADALRSFYGSATET